MYVPTCIISVYEKCHKGKTSFREALLRLLPMISVSLATAMWLYSPLSSIRESGHLYLFGISLGLGFGKMATKIIYAHLTKLPFPSYSGLMLPLFYGCFLINLPLVFPILPAIPKSLEIGYLWVWFVFALIGYFNWSYHVIQSFCQYLDINCLTIKQKCKPGVVAVDHHHTKKE